MKNWIWPDAVLHGREARLAHHALEHHAAGDGDFERIRFERFLVGVLVLRLQIVGVVRGTEIVRVGDALFTQLAQLFAALGHDLVVVHLGRDIRLGRIRLGRFSHDDLVFGGPPRNAPQAGGQSV